MASMQATSNFDDEEFNEESFSYRERNFVNVSPRSSAYVRVQREPIVVPQPVEIVVQHPNQDGPNGFFIISTGFRLTSAFCENVLAHPFTVLRRQCQVHETAGRYHLLPITLIPVIIKIQGRQGIGTLWKGIGSIFIVKGLAIVCEDVVGQLTRWPTEMSSRHSTKRICQHLLLKMLSAALVTPFYSTSLIQTVQSDIASEKPGILDCLIEGFKRIVPNKHLPTSHILPFWMLVVPTAVHGVVHYLISSAVQRGVLSLWKYRQLKRKDQTNRDPTLVDKAYAEPYSLLMGCIVAETVLFPLQTIIHRMYVQGTRTIIDNLDNGLEVTPVITRYRGPFDCLSTIVSEEGTSGLFKGFGAFMLQYALHVSILKLAKFALDELYTRSQRRPSP